MRKGFNPIRRNRNIGTAKQGLGRDNRLTIPSICHSERIWWETLRDFVLLDRFIGDRKITFIVERTRKDFYYACPPDDVCRMLSLLPEEDVEQIETVVFRQSTRKEWLITPTWGRLAYSADLGRPGRKSVRQGPAIFLEAVNPAHPWRWSKSLSPQDSAELRRLVADGHAIEDRGNDFLLRSSLDSIRNTQLYRTIPHEVGHWVDWIEKVLRPLSSSESLESLEDVYFQRPSREREEYAHRYADNLRTRLLTAGLIPFARSASQSDILRDGLNPDDFIAK